MKKLNKDMSKFIESIKASNRKRYRIQCIRYYDKPDQFFPQYKEPGFLTEWKFYTLELESPITFENWKNRTVRIDMNERVISFSSEYEAEEFIEEMKRRDNHNIKDIVIIELSSNKEKETV